MFITTITTTGRKVSMITFLNKKDMKKCKQCGQKDGVHKMSCESKKQFIVFQQLSDEGVIGDKNIFKMLNDIVNGKLNKP